MTQHKKERAEELTTLLRQRTEWTTILHKTEKLQHKVNDIYNGVRREFIHLDDIKRDYQHLFNDDDGIVKMKSLDDFVDRSRVRLVEINYDENKKEIIENTGLRVDREPVAGAVNRTRKGNTRSAQPA